MSKELPYFRFYVNEWLNDDISFTSYSVKGVFMDVCSMYWFRDCSITIAMLEQRITNATEELEELVNLNIIKADDSGNVTIKFLDEQYDKLSEKRKKRVEAGRKGGLARSSNAKANAKQSSSYKDKDKDKEKDIVTALADDVPNASDVETWQSAIRVSDYLFDAICEYDPTHKYTKNKPSIRNWVEQVDLAIRRDERTEEQLKFIIDAVFRQSHKFPDLWDKWAMNIESGKKLRDKFDKIKNQIKSTVGNTYESKQNDANNFLDRYYTESNV